MALKALALTAIVAIAVAGGIALGRGESPLEWFERDRSTPSEPVLGILPEAQPESSDPAMGQAQQSDTLQVVDPAAEGDTAAGNLPSDGTGGSDPAEASAPAAEETEPESEQAAQTDDEGLANPVDTVTLYIERWLDADYGGMYDLLSEDAQTTVGRQEFIDRYNGIMTEAGVNSLVAVITGAASGDDQVPIHVEMQSGLVGTITQDNLVSTVRDGDAWKIVWTPSLIIAGLDDDCVEYTGDSLSRGDILDRDGEPLAYDGVVNQVGIIPGQMENETQTVAALARLLDMKTSDIKDRYKDGNPEWFWPITELPDPIDTEILNSISNMSGVALREKTSRIYPQGAVTAHITGYVTTITAEDIEADESGELSSNGVLGRAGIEAAANDILAGKPGGRLSIVKCSTRAELSVIAERPSIAPQDIILTVDIDFQKVVDSALGDVSGSAVILNPQTGAIMALVSHPSFDPNLFVKGLTDKEAKAMFDEQKRPLINRALQQGYPTGSIFKVITMAAAMKHLGYEGGSEIYCPTDWSIPGTDQIWRDWTYEYGVGDQGWLNLHTALVNSCNTVFYELGYELDQTDNNLLPEMTLAFGLGAPTGIPYMQEIAGTVPTPEWKLATMNDYWATGDAVNLAIGQGYLEATPLQMANAYAAIANGGYLLQPFIVESLRDADGARTVVGERTEIHRLPISRSIVREIQSALRDQTSNSWGAGSVSVFGDFSWPIAGKTGTAQNQLTRSQTPHSWFAAFGPYGEDAEITSIVMVESVGEGVSFAAPTTREIYLAWLGA